MLLEPLHPDPRVKIRKLKIQDRHYKNVYNKERSKEETKQIVMEI